MITRYTERLPFDHRFIAIDPTTGAECTIEVFADGGRLRGRDGIAVYTSKTAPDGVVDLLKLLGRVRCVPAGS